MKRIDTATAVPDLFGSGKPGFRDGNLAAGQAPTDLNAKWFNQVQEEIARVIEAAGITLNEGDLTQLLQAIKTLSAPSLTIISTSGTWTAPKAGWYLVRGTGGGGGGNGANGNSSAQTISGAGGGAGATFVKLLQIAAGAVFTVTIGAGGSGSPNGTAGSGGSTSFGPSLVAAGGQGAQFGSATSQAGGLGGAATGGDLNLQGGDGADGQSSSWMGLGNGGASFWGGGGRAGSGGGYPGIAPGAGGGGAYDPSLSGTVKYGAAGAAGKVEILFMGG